MKIAIIGTGFIANTHVQAIRSLGHEIPIVISRNERKASQFAKKWSIPKFGTKFELALKESDCLHLCTPPLAHYKYAKAAILAKKHIICEKPLCIDPLKAKELSQLADQNGVIAAVCFNIRFYEACQRAKTIIKQKEFGKIRLIHGSYLQEYHAGADYYSWRYQTENGGKMRATTEIGSHWIDLVRYWTGLEISAVAANFANFTPNRYLTKEGLLHPNTKQNSELIQVQNEDVATIFIKFDNGAIGNLIISEVAHGRKNELRLEVSSDKQSIWWNNEKPYQLHFGKKNQGIKVESQPFAGGFRDTFKVLFSEVYDAITQNRYNKDQSFPTFKDGFINAAICEAIYQSANNKSIWVDI